MAVSVECASRLFLALWLCVHLLTITSIAALAFPGQWSGPHGFFTTPDPNSELAVSRALVVIGLLGIVGSLMLEWVWLICWKAEFTCSKCFRGTLFLGAFFGLLGSLIGVTHLPGYVDGSMGPMAHLAISSFALIGILTMAMAALCDNCCPAPARLVHGDLYSSRDRTAMTRIQVLGVGYWLSDKGSQALSALGRQNADPALGFSAPPNSPAEDRRQVREGQGAAPVMPEGHRLVVPNPSSVDPEQRVRLEQAQRVGTRPVYKPYMVPNLDGIQEESESGRSSAASSERAQTPVLGVSNTFEKSSETGLQESETSSTETIAQGASADVLDLKDVKRAARPRRKQRRD